jgi:hypothetical protein
MAQSTWVTWEQEVFARGELRGSRVMLRIVLEAQFGQLPEDLIRRIETTEDLEKLEAWVQQAACITSLDQLVL